MIDILFSNREMQRKISRIENFPKWDVEVKEQTDFPKMSEIWQKEKTFESCYLLKHCLLVYAADSQMVTD